MLHGPQTKPKIKNTHTGALHPDPVQIIHATVPGVQAIYLFGSHALDEQHADSDINFAILSKHKSSETTTWELAQKLAAEYSREVDLIELKQASTVMRMQIISKGRHLFCANRNFCETFENIVFSDYARLNEERAGILEDIRQRGSVYG